MTCVQIENEVKKMLEVEGEHVPHCSIAGDANGRVFNVNHWSFLVERVVTVVLPGFQLSTNSVKAGRMRTLHVVLVFVTVEVDSHEYAAH